MVGLDREVCLHRCQRDTNEVSSDDKLTPDETLPPTGWRRFCTMRCRVKRTLLSSRLNLHKEKYQWTGDVSVLTWSNLFHHWEIYNYSKVNLNAGPGLRLQPDTTLSLQQVAHGNLFALKWCCLSAAWPPQYANNNKQSCSAEKSNRRFARNEPLYGSDITTSLWC